MERRRLDSVATFGIKFVVPALWLAALARAIQMVLREPASPSPGFVVFCVLSGAFMLRQTYGLKRVDLVGQTLVISDYLKEIAVPLNQIERITQLPMTNSPVTIHLRNHTDLGRKIRFFPGMRAINGISNHPVVAELSDAAHLTHA
jgi:hypothetical protein